MLGGIESRAGSSAGKAAARKVEEAGESGGAAAESGDALARRVVVRESVIAAGPARKPGMRTTIPRMTRTRAKMDQPMTMRLTFTGPPVGD
jgi:hypothetical protein